MSHRSPGRPSAYGGSPRRTLAPLLRLLRPRGGRMLILGVSLAVGGLAGGVRGLSDGGGLLVGAAQLALGIVGVALAAACVVEYGKRG